MRSPVSTWTGDHLMVNQLGMLSTTQINSASVDKRNEYQWKQGCKQAHHVKH